MEANNGFLSSWRVPSERSASGAEIKVLAASSQIVGSSKVRGRRREFWSLGVPPRSVILVSTLPASSPLVVRTGLTASLSLASPWIMVRWEGRRDLAMPGWERRMRAVSLEEMRARAMQW